MYFIYNKLILFELYDKVQFKIKLHLKKALSIFIFNCLLLIIYFL